MTEPEHTQRSTHVGPYRILRRLGTGGMGVVYLGQHEASGTTAAVKLLRPEYVADPRLRARLRREVAAARRVPRACTAPVLGADLDADPPWIATEYIEGPTLEVVLLEHGRLRGAALEIFAAGVAVALRAIHAHGVIHRDLKPTNVLLSPLGPRVIDFGVARVEHGSGTPPTELTKPGAVVGTPAYMAPEQLSSKPVTPAADVFAWAGLVTYAATGRPAFGAGKAALRAVVSEQPDLGDLPEPLRGLVAAAFDKDPARRPAAAELVDRLSVGAPDATTQVLAGADAVAHRPPRRGRRWAVAAAITAAAAALASALAVTVVLPWLRPAEPAPLAGVPVTIGVFHGWEEGIAASFLWKIALAEQGADVQVRFADVEVIYAGVAAGDFDVAFDAWLPATHTEYWERHGSGLEDLGTWYTDAALTIAVNDDAPVRSLAELAGAADAFGNQLVGIEAGAGLTRITEQRVIPTYGLQDMQFRVSSTGDMRNRLRVAFDREDNIVVTLWQPHWFYDAFPIRNLADPENALGDPDDLHAFARTGFSADQPEIAAWIRGFTMTEEHLRSLELVIFHDHDATTNAEIEEAVRQWLDRHPDYYRGLVEGLAVDQ